MVKTTKFKNTMTEDFSFTTTDIDVVGNTDHNTYIARYNYSTCLYEVSIMSITEEDFYEFTASEVREKIYNGEWLVI